MSALISVVIPVFNGSPHIKDSLESVLQQTHANMEIVLVDGGSTDGSREWIFEQSDPRIRAKVMPHGISAAENWNAASHEASGEYIKLLCQDDILYPHALEQQLSELEAHPNASFAVARRDIVDARGKMIYRNRGLRNMKPGPMTGMTALEISYLSGTNNLGEPVAILFRHEALDAVLNWDDQRPFLLDLDLYTKALQTQSIVVSTNSIGAFRVSSSSWSTRLVEEQTNQLRAWQHEVAEILDPAPTRTKRIRAELALHQQSWLRRMAYRVLKLRGNFTSQGTAGRLTP